MGDAALAVRRACELFHVPVSWLAFLASEAVRVEVLSVGVTGQTLSNPTGSTVPTTPLDGPGSERSRGEHIDEILVLNGAACGSQYPGS